MSKRILNIYLYQDGDELHIRMINIHPWTRIEDMSQGRLYIWQTEPDATAEAGLLHFLSACCDINNITTKDPFWGNMKFIPQQGGFEIYNNQAQHTQVGVYVTLPEADYPVYQYQDMLMTLPQTDKKTLFMLLLALDPTIHSFRDAPGVQVEYQITLFEQEPMPDFTNPGAILIEAINPTKEDKLGKIIGVEHSLSRQVAKWLTSQSSNQDLKTTLEQLLASGHPSFMLAIQEQLYQQPTIEEFIRDNCKDGSAMSALFNPAIPHSQAEKMLKKELKPRSEQSLTEWCHEFERLKSMLWKQMVETLIAKKSIEGGFYNHQYTEIELLKVAEFGTSKSGNITLMFNQTQNYKKYYAKGQLNYDIIEQELRFAGDLMGLHFLSDQDFHAESVAFDEESTTYLLNRGFHITTDFVKSLIKESAHTPRMFQLPHNPGTESNSDSLAQSHEATFN